jgi:hypothetical protein
MQRLANNIVGINEFTVGKSVVWTATQIAAMPDWCVRSSDGAVFEIINGATATISDKYFTSLVSDGANVYSVLGQKIWQVPLR